MSSYEPGHCNIGPAQRRRRLAVAGVAFGLAALTVLARVAGVLPAPLLGAVFVFLAVGFEWGIQAYSAFCVRLALLGRYDFRDAGGDTGAVTDGAAREADQVQAAKITAVAVVLAAVGTGCLTLLLR